MKYDEAVKHLHLLAEAVDYTAQCLSWMLARNTLPARERRAKAHVDKLRADNEAFDRSGELTHQRAVRDIMTEEGATGEQAAGAARYRLEPLVQELERQYQQLLTQSRADVARSFPAALDGFRPVDMLQVAAYRESRRAAIESASVSTLLQIAKRALKMDDDGAEPADRDAAGFVDLQLVEERHARGPLSRQPSDIPIVRQLDLLIGETQELRVPLDLDQMTAIERTMVSGRKAVSMAELVQIRPVNIEQTANAAAKRAYEAETSAYAGTIAAGGAGAA